MTSNYWEERIETMSRKALKALQLERLKNTVETTAKSPYYKKTFEDKGITLKSV